MAYLLLLVSVQGIYINALCVRIFMLDDVQNVYEDVTMQKINISLAFMLVCYIIKNKLANVSLNYFAAVETFIK